MLVTRNPLSTILAAWVVTGIVRVVLGSSTSPVAYFFFGVFWLVSIILLVAAIRQLVMSKKADQRAEAIAICAALASVFVQGLVGGGGTIAVAAIVFFVSVFALLFIYGRRLRRGQLLHP